MKAQTNLVPNGSFEILDTCPYWDGQIYFAKPWFQPCTFYGNVNNSSSSDLFNVCATHPWFGVPDNSGFVSYQFPQHGNGYSGIGLLNSGNIRESIETKLLQTLEVNVEYCISFYVVNAGATSTDCIHLGFGSDSLLTNTFYLPVTGVIPVVSADTLITDTLNWIEISGTYIANGTENYILIGNLLDNSFCNYDDMSLGGGYYYIDNVSIYKCSDTMDSSDRDVIIPNIFSPNNDDANDIFRIIGAEGQTHMEIYNRWGEKIFFANGHNAYWDGWTYDAVQCPDGVYFYIVTIEDKTYKGYVHLLR